MRLLKTLGWIVGLWALVAATPVQAGLVSFDVVFNVSDAADGNTFGLVAGTSDAVGSFTYDTDDLDEFFTVTPETASIFDFWVDLAGTLFTASDDAAYPFWPTVFTEDGNPLSIWLFDYQGIVGAATLSLVWDTFIYFSATIDGVEVAFGTVDFVPVTSAVSEPGTWLISLMLVMVPLVTRRRRS